ncbi:MAG: XRE family transcriptional regulator [Atopobiaceae bacterium]|jgi:SOS-response transcriptional repressor LexA|nr:XRE family transcriptional regulator [Atopobiaceae bacterium]
MNVGDNIRRLRKEAHMTQEELASAVGVARSTVTQWERNWSQPRMGKVAKIAEALGTSISDVIYGSALADYAPDQPQTSGNELTIPLFTLGKVHAGDFSEEMETTKRIAVPATVLSNHPNAQAALVVGDCMDKVAPEGMAVVYDPMLEPTNGKVVIVETEDHEAIMRRWYRGGNTLMLVADSHAPYDDIVITGNQPIRVIGTVVWVQSPEEL